jgi:formylglycine-generating enzyme required for sulfatase activity
VAEHENHTIRKITPSGMVTTFAGIAGIKSSADGPAAIAHFSFPNGVALGPDGSVFVADGGNSTIRKITPDGVVSTVAGQHGIKGSMDGAGSSARFIEPYAISAGTNGFIYVADSANNTIRVINPNGVVSTLAGQSGVAGSVDGVTTNAQFNWPSGIAVDGEGNLYVADTGNNTIRKITSAGVVTTIGGVAGKSGSKDGTGSDAWFNTPVGIAVDSHGNIYVSDDGNNTIRKGHRQSSPAPTATAQTTTMARQPNPPIVKPWENSLGMKFVPVPGTKVWFGIWDVRVRDYRAYAQANNGVHGSWQRPQWAGAVVTPREDCPVVAVSWNDAKAFCSWLTKKERDEKKISNSQSYRLPFEAEWSQAVGRSKYPWGDDWPPPLGAGNFADSTFKSNFPDQSAIDGYNDGYAMTSPVESFRPNQYGLYDMGGNVSQFCEDWYDSVQQTRVLRGSSWLDYKPANLLASNRGGFSTNRSHSVFGFRVVLADNSSR